MILINSAVGYNMTVDELRTELNNRYGLNEWPMIYEVDSITYVNCVQAVLKWAWDKNDIQHLSNGGRTLEIAVGPNNGLMFKNIELLLRK